MRRLEFVEGTSSKFWQAEVKGKTFSVVYGKIGTNGQRKDKDFPTEAAAQKEFEKKLAEKLKEGYKEAGAAPEAPKVEAPPEPPKRPVPPPRVVAARPTAEQLSHAVSALEALRAALGKRSWVVNLQAKHTRRALERIAGVDPASSAPLADAFDALFRLVVAKKGEPRLSLRIAMELLSELSAEAFARALSLWKESPEEAPARAAVAVLAAQREALDDVEMGLRVGALLADRPAFELGWERRWKGLKPHLDAHLGFYGKTLKDYIKGIDAQGDKQVARRAASMR